MTSMGPYNPIAITANLNVTKPDKVINIHSIAGRLLSNPDFSFFLKIVEKSMFLPKLECIQANFTLFVPSNKAISQKYETPDIQQGLAYNIVRGMMLHNRIGSDLFTCVPIKQLTTLHSSHNLTFTNRGDTTMINNKVKILMPDLKCSNGIIHVVDDIIFPSYQPSF